jgi:hypothetical protein
MGLKFQHYRCLDGEALTQLVGFIIWILAIRDGLQPTELSYGVLQQPKHQVLEDPA